MTINPRDEGQSPKLDRTIQTHIGQHLRTAYEVVGLAPVPERLLQLLQAFERALAAKGQTIDPNVRAQMLAALPSLRAFAMSLTNNPDRADDLVQETVMRAWKNLARFEEGTNLHAWLFTILRNTFFSELRKRKHEVEDGDGSYAAKLKVAPDQIMKLEFQDLQAALQTLNPDQREALILVAAQGLSYEEAAEICGVAVGTIKSRVNRARIKMAELLSHTDPDDIGADRITKAALGNL